MAGLWAVFRLELKLLLRSSSIWMLAVVTTFFGVWEASAVREFPIGAWGQFTTAALFVTLILTLSTGGQITRDRDHRIDGVLLSAPVATAAYVWGKYLAAVAVLLALAAPMVTGAIAMDRFDTWSDPPAVLGHSRYPSLGPWPYITGWLWLVVIPVVFGAALALAAVTLTRGQRVASSLLVILFWLGPSFLLGQAMYGSSYSGDWRNLIDVSTTTYSTLISSPDIPSALQQIYTLGTPPPEVAAQVVQLMVAHLPPDLPAIFYWNRVFFAALALMLVHLTIYHLRAYRRGA